MAGRDQDRRQRRSAREWSELLSRFAASGLSVAAFCEQEEISAASLYRWRSLLGGAIESRAMDADAPMPAFVDLGGLGAPRPASERLEIRLDLGGGLVLSLVRR